MSLLNTSVAGEIIKIRREWKNDVPVFNVNDKVLLRQTFDNSIKTKLKPLKNNLDAVVYTVTNINDFNVDISGENSVCTKISIILDYLDLNK